jgi:LPPG:FO 2-phospho-L-lactate transferase
VTVVGNTGDDVVLGGHLVCPDLDTVLFLQGGVLDRERWWGIADDTTSTHDRLLELADAGGLGTGPRFLPAERQTEGRAIGTWRRFSGIGEFMLIGDRDRAVHITRTSLIDEGATLTEATRTLARAFGLDLELLPMSDDPVASIIHTPSDEQHFQEFWVAKDGNPSVEAVEFRGAETAVMTDAVGAALDSSVVIGPSNPVTSIGPILALGGVSDALAATPVVAVSPFVEDRVFSGPAAKLMAAAGYEPNTAGVAEAFPFADAFILDNDDGTVLDRPTIRTDTHIATPEDASRVWDACQAALAEVA